MEQHNHKRALVPKGSDIKLAIKITSLGDGIQLSDDEVSLTAEIIVADHSETFHKDDMKKLSDDTYILPLPTSVFPRGDMYILTYTSVPDKDFPDGYRDESQKNDTGITLI